MYIPSWLKSKQDFVYLVICLIQEVLITVVIMHGHLESDVFMENLDLAECSDSTFLPDFDGTVGEFPITLDEIKPKMEYRDGNGLDPRLIRAVRKSETEGSITPIVKEELRCYIAAKRHFQGKTEIKTEFKEPKIHPLTPDEIRKKERRREQNRRAATKCRKKKKEAKIIKETEMSTLRNMNESLCKEVKLLKQQLTYMRDIMSEHEASGQCFLHRPFLNASQMNQLDRNYQEDADHASEALYSPHSPNSLFTYPPGVHQSASPEQYQAQEDRGAAGHIHMPLQLPGHRQTITLNGTISLTPPVSPYMTEFPEIVDPQLSDVLRGVDYHAM